MHKAEAARLAARSFLRFFQLCTQHGWCSTARCNTLALQCATFAPHCVMSSCSATPRFRMQTRICLFFLQTTGCPYGDRCFYAHGDHELRDDPASDVPGVSPESNSRFKTRLCRWFVESNGTSCPHGMYASAKLNFCNVEWGGGKLANKCNAGDRALHRCWVPLTHGTMRLSARPQYVTAFVCTFCAYAQAFGVH
ncbi:zinc finger CCCH domain-containing protein, partial [archaeon]